MSSLQSFSDPSDTTESSTFSSDEGAEMPVSLEEMQDTNGETLAGRILGVDPLATASDLGII